MKVGLLVQDITPAGGGVAEAVRLTYKALAQHGDVHVRVFTLRTEGYEQYAYQFGGSELVASSSVGPRRFPLSASMLAQLAKARLDVLHVHGVWSFQCLAGLLWHIRTGKPLVIVPHGMLEEWIVGRSAKLKQLVRTLFQDRAIRSSTVQALSEEEATSIRRIYPDAKIVVVPNGVEVAEADDTPPDWWSERQQGKTIFGFLGRLHEKKGVVELCEAWERACESSEAFRQQSSLVICGWLDGLADLPERVEKANKKYGNIMLAGAQFGEAKRRTLKHLHYMVLPSRSEGQPLSILEAWSAGVPAIMTPGCNLPIGFEEGAAISCSTDPESLAGTLIGAPPFSSEPYRAMRHNATRVHQRYYSLEKLGDSLVSLYRASLEAQRS